MSVFFNASTLVYIYSGHDAYTLVKFHYIYLNERIYDYFFYDCRFLSYDNLFISLDKISRVPE
jgi:hypothetical protein